MNGSTMNYNKYLESLEKTPMTMFKEPTTRIDFGGLAKFAKKCGKQITELNEDEKKRFMKDK